MIPFKIGNWEILEDGIKWNGKGGRELIIDIDRITESGYGNRENTYDWLIHLTEKSWLSREDIYALNSALIYSIYAFNLNINSNSFILTFTKQEEELNLRE